MTHAPCRRSTTCAAVDLNLGLEAAVGGNQAWVERVAGIDNLVRRMEEELQSKVSHGVAALEKQSAARAKKAQGNKASSKSSSKPAKSTS